MSASGRVSSIFRGHPPVTVSLIFLCAVVLISQVATAGAVARGGDLYGPQVANGDIWRIISAGFLHADPMHIAFNMFGLWIFGNVLERSLGSLAFMGIYFSSLVGGSAMVLAFNFNNPTLGASGAVIGSAAAIVTLMAARGENVLQSRLVFILGANLLLPLIAPEISYWGHLGGAFGGVISGELYLSSRERFGGKRVHIVLAAFAIALFVLAIVIANTVGPDLSEMLEPQQ